MWRETLGEPIYIDLRGQNPIAKLREFTDQIMQE
jgi:hypothetical protein